MRPAHGRTLGATRMASEYAALVNDLYINQRVNLKMDLSMKRDTVLAMFDRVRREVPGMDRFKRYTNELALESRGEAGGESSRAAETEEVAGSAGVGASGGGGQRWLAVRKTSVRTGSVNPDTPREGYTLHRLVLELAPYFLDITALDIDHIELLYGFDMLAPGNHDAIVFNALLAGSPLAALVTEGGRIERTPVDCQPLLGVALSDGHDVQAHFEVKTRSSARHGRHIDGREEPISLYLVLRKYGPFGEVKDLPKVLRNLVDRGEDLLDSVVVPRLLMPLREAIASGHG